MPKTWTAVSRQVIGYVDLQTPINEQYVAEHTVQRLVDEGYNDSQIAMIWNGSLGGSEKPVAKKGVNRFKVKFNTIAYAQSVIKNLIKSN